MSASSDLQAAIEALLRAPGALSANVPIVKRRTKEVGAEIEAATAKQGGLCIYVMPPLPTHANFDPALFFDRAEIRVRIVEQPSLTGAGADAYDLADDVALALHWAAIPSILAHPLFIAERPMEIAEDPKYRIIDVIFTAVYGLLKS